MGGGRPAALGPGGMLSRTYFVCEILRTPVLDESLFVQYMEAFVFFMFLNVVFDWISQNCTLHPRLCPENPAYPLATSAPAADEK
jgi:hypothetical protein